MSTAVELLESGKVWALPAAQPFNETAWQAWAAKGRAHDRRAGAARNRLVRLIPAVVLLVTAALWSQMAPYQPVVRFIVAASAAVVMFQAFHQKHYIAAAVFGALALLYNPIVPVFGFSDDVRRALVLASAAPFAVSLVRGYSRRKQNV